MSIAPPGFRRYPVATAVLVTINVGVWLWQVLSGVPWAHPSSVQLLHWGADMPALTLTGDWWRLATSMFLHGGLLHLALNMVALAFTGPRTEDEFGAPRMLAIYLAGGLLASCASTTWFTVHHLSASAARQHAGLLSVSVGASGAVMALLGALLAAALLGLPYKGNPEPARTIDKGLLQVIVVNVGLGFFVHGVDQAAHVGGLVGGFLIGIILGVAWKKSGLAIAVARFAATFALIAGCLVALFRLGDPVTLMALRAQIVEQQRADH
jgi:membrane associated rhomboid family serine protease